MNTKYSFSDVLLKFTKGVFADLVGSFVFLSIGSLVVLLGYYFTTLGQTWPIVSYTLIMCAIMAIYMAYIFEEK